MSYSCVGGQLVVDSQCVERVFPRPSGFFVPSRALRFTTIRLLALSMAETSSFAALGRRGRIAG